MILLHTRYAMAGAKAAHNHIVSNINSAFHMHLKGKSCSSMMSDMKVKIDGCYFYADVLVDCSDLADDSVFTETPTIIVGYCLNPRARLTV